MFAVIFYSILLSLFKFIFINIIFLKYDQIILRFEGRMISENKEEND